MKTSLLVLTALTLSACASVGELENAPDTVFQSDKPAEKVAGCIAKNWSTSDWWRDPANMQIREDGYVVSLPNDHPMVAVDAVARIRSTETGSSVSYAERTPALSMAWMQDDVTSCL